ncbi:NADP-dependent oxidoreductase [Amycolatopsis sp. cg5]|uniref:NADP-dependent oxidoreductase n=1 Tax=Amycolatopsis sp. cg5 TaxID=3238802 RepID=UPI003526AC14
MRVVTQQEFGGPEVLRVIETDRPAPGPTEVLVRVHAAGINPVDWKSRAHEVFMGEPPYTLGWDVSGVVEELGFGATGVDVGDEVLGMPLFPKQAAAYADYVVAPSRHFVRKPENLSHAEAAGLPLAGLTAWQALVDVANVRPGQRVLVDGAAGGVGHLAVQIAKARGAYVLGAASAPKHDFLRSIGVDEPLDYRDPAVTASEVDVLLAVVGPESTTRWLPAVRDSGIVVTVAAGGADGVRHRQVLVEPDQIGLTGLVGLIEKGQLKVHVEQAFTLEDVAKAHELGEGGRVVGKLVLNVL